MEQLDAFELIYGAHKSRMAEKNTAQTDPYSPACRSFRSA